LITLKEFSLLTKLNYLEKEAKSKLGFEVSGPNFPILLIWSMQTDGSISSTSKMLPYTLETQKGILYR
jgi:hypothetical protein